MAEEETNEQPESPEAQSRRRSRSLTPEQRRLLGIRRPLHERGETEQPGAEESPVGEVPASPAPEAPEAREPQKRPEKKPIAEEAPKAEPAVAERETTTRSTLRRDEKSSRVIEVQHAALIIGMLVMLGLTFYVGKKFDYWRHVLRAKKNEPKLTKQVVDKFPNVSAENLVEQALTAERTRKWSDVAERLIAAKQKNLRYRGILFRIAKIAYDSGDFDNADKFFDRAIAFGENVDAANYYRGLIATRRRDLAAAERYFEAAATAEPFIADYYYYWGEALRLNHHPQEAIARYEQAERRARGEQDIAVCRFKARMARLEAGETTKLKTEIEAAGSAGPLALDWLLTSVALAIREGRIEDAARSLADARVFSQRTENGSGIFVSCTGDSVFQDACRKHNELADICQARATSK